MTSAERGSTRRLYRVVGQTFLKVLLKPVTDKFFNFLYLGLSGWKTWSALFLGSVSKTHPQHDVRNEYFVIQVYFQAFLEEAALFCLVLVKYLAHQKFQEFLD